MKSEAAQVECMHVVHVPTAVGADPAESLVSAKVCCGGELELSCEVSKMPLVAYWDHADFARSYCSYNRLRFPVHRARARS